MSDVGRAHVDPAFGARVVARTKLLYAEGADALSDRPAHVRAGSALASWGDALYVIQDDASFLAIIEPTTGLARAFAFPGDGVRQFDDTRGNKKLKLDLEAAFVTPDGMLVALGSGSTALRERIVLVDTRAPNVITIAQAPALYAALRAEARFSGSELNIEGAAVAGDDLVLFQRGNGAPRDALVPVDATCRLSLREVLDHVQNGGPVPTIRAILPWRLGSLPGQSNRLTFTDGAVHASGKMAFLACAEDSPDVTRDGPVSAVVVGVLDESARTATIGAILDERGRPLLDKAEGLAFHPSQPKRAFVVTDRDDPAAPSELLELELGAAW